MCPLYPCVRGTIRMCAPCTHTGSSASSLDITLTPVTSSNIPTTSPWPQSTATSPQPQTTGSAKPPPSSDSNAGAIVGGVIGVLLFITIVSLVAFLCFLYIRSEYVDVCAIGCAQFHHSAGTLLVFPFLQG